MFELSTPCFLDNDYKKINMSQSRAVKLYNVQCIN